MIKQLLFLYFSLAMIVFALIGLTRKNIIHGILWVLLMFVHLGGLYLLLNAEFLAIIQIIVYVGAILVMFLFVIFLLDIKKEEKEVAFIKSWPLRVVGLLLLIFFALLGVATYHDHPTTSFSLGLSGKMGQPKALGITLFKNYLYPFLILAFILFIPLIGLGMVVRRRKANGSS